MSEPISRQSSRPPSDYYDDAGAQCASEPAQRRVSSDPGPVASSSAGADPAAALVARHSQRAALPPAMPARPSADCSVEVARAAAVCASAVVATAAGAPTVALGIAGAFIGGAACAVAVIDAHDCVSDSQ